MSEKKFSFPTWGEINKKSKNKNNKQRTLLKLVEHQLMENAPLERGMRVRINLGESCKNPILTVQAFALTELFEKTGRWEADYNIGHNDGGRPVYLYLTPYLSICRWRLFG